MATERQSVSKKNCWDVEAMYPTLADWGKEYELNINSTAPRWPEIAKFKGRLAESPETLKQAMDLILTTDRKLSRLYTYSHLRHDENLTHDEHTIAYGKMMSILNDFQEEISWVEPELLAIPDPQMKTLLQSPQLAEYRFHLEKIIRIKPHVLPLEQEELLAIAGKALQTPPKIFSALNDADFKFGTVFDSQGEAKELTIGSYGVYQRDQDRTLRQNAFMKLHGKYAEYENTFSELLQGQMQAHWFNARARHYPSCLDAALFPKNIDTAVYHALITAVHEQIHVLHKYMALRKKCLKGIDQLHLYDMYVPLTSQCDVEIPYEEAEELVIESVAPLGKEYQSILRDGLKNQRWVDRFENQNKRSGAYSSGCYDSAPYILMNYKDILRDVFTLAHEAGHSMHSYYSKKQPYQYSDYPIFLAEVASTFNEELLTQLLIARAKSKDEKIYLITQKIDDIRTTLFRQTMFAEFELMIHQKVEQNIPFTPKQLREEFRKLNEFYFGSSVVIDQEAAIEWARIPHFYYNFYVYQYATGISAALALVDRVVNGGKPELEGYLSFLKGGSSIYPIEMLQKAGVDMRSPEPVKAAIRRFDKLVDQLDQLTR